MDFIQVDITAHPDFCEILIAELSEAGYDSFWERDESSFIAYIEKNAFSESALADLKLKYPEAQISWQYEGLESKNWNEEWEKNFQPIVVSGRCYIRSTFHEPKPHFPLEIIIEPKMSFGTGHHATTSMMVELLLAVYLKDKKVMDVGTGTGILAIAAEKLGAKQVYAFDVDDWSIENTRENVALNHCTNITIEKGTISDLLPSQGYDVVLANITRNILLDELPNYVACLNVGGYLAISGFYTQDLSAFTPLSQSLKLSPEKSLIRDNWAAILFKKKG